MQHRTEFDRKVLQLAIQYLLMLGDRSLELIQLESSRPAIPAKDTLSFSLIFLGLMPFTFLSAKKMLNTSDQPGFATPTSDHYQITARVFVLETWVWKSQSVSTNFGRICSPARFIKLAVILTFFSTCQLEEFHFFEDILIPVNKTRLENISHIG